MGGKSFKTFYGFRQTKPFKFEILMQGNPKKRNSVSLYLWTNPKFNFPSFNLDPNFIQCNIFLYIANWKSSDYWFYQSVLENSIVYQQIECDEYFISLIKLFKLKFVNSFYWFWSYWHANSALQNGWKVEGSIHMSEGFSLIYTS